MSIYCENDYISNQLEEFSSEEEFNRLIYNT